MGGAVVDVVCLPDKGTALLPRTSAIPTYLRGDWYRDWGAIERYYRAVPAQQAPDAAIEEGTTRVFGWSRGGPIRALP